VVKKLFTAKLIPSAYLKRIFRHNSEVSEGSKSKVIARRKLLGRVVTFYQNGLRLIDGINITEQEQFDSQILKFAHASILIEGPVGDKKACYVDATKNPIEVWVYEQRIEDFIKKYMTLTRTGNVDVDFLLGKSLIHSEELEHERNVKLLGR
jgi:hypothetical protein